MNNALGNHDCPPLMSDGRVVTDYRPNCELHDMIIRQNGLRTSYDYRQFMINNAITLMNIDRDYYIAKNQCNTCRFYQPDPNAQESYWNAATAAFGYQRK
jgi:hypothetical protein